MSLIEYMLDKKLFYLIIGFICSIFSIAKYNLSLFIFIWPYCFLAYLHKFEKKLFPIIIVSICLLISNMFRWIGFSDKSVFLDFLIGIYFSIINIIPFIIDIILYNKIEKWASVFIFPSSIAFIEYVAAFCPIANYNCYAYALRDYISFIQISSLFGSYFISFIIAFFASNLDFSLNNYKSKNEISKLIYCYIIIILLINIFGFIRLLIKEEGGKNNIVASLGSSQCLYVNGKESVLSINDYIDYIKKTIIRANNSEAQLIIYAEEAFAILIKDREEIVKRTVDLAKEYNIFVVLSLDIMFDENNNTNEAILISNKGDILYNYQKQHLIPYIEDDYYKTKIEAKTFSTDLGKLGVVICYDIAFPYYINSLSNLGMDLLLIPSWDWNGITEHHSVNVRFRAIENGINIIKSTANGIVLSTDYKGRFLSYYISSSCEDYFVFSNINKAGVKTLYLYIGIAFNYLYLLAIIILIIIGRYKLIQKRRNNLGSIDANNLIEFNLEN